METLNDLYDQIIKDSAFDMKELDKIEGKDIIIKRFIRMVKANYNYSLSDKEVSYFNLKYEVDLLMRAIIKVEPNEDDKMMMHDLIETETNHVIAYGIDNDFLTETDGLSFRWYLLLHERLEFPEDKNELEKALYYWTCGFNQQSPFSS